MNDQKDKSKPNPSPVAVVTGSSSGIGKAVAIALAKNGYDVVVHAASNQKGGQDTVNEIQSLGQRSSLVLHDFLSGDLEITNFFHRVKSCYERIDYLVNCAGADILTTTNKGKSFEEKLEILWKVDVRSCLVLCRLAADEMLKQESGGSIVNIGWDGATTGLPGESGQLFATVKGAVHSMSLSLAQSYGPKVRVNCVAPGWIQTKWGEEAEDGWRSWISDHSLQNRWGQPEDIAELISFLASSKSSYINGQILEVNGGRQAAFGSMRNELQKVSPDHNNSDNH